MIPSKQKHRADWMKHFESMVIFLTDGALSGRIDWDTAQHFYFSGESYAKAAQRYVESRKGDV
jgi:hypothetical protein